MNSYKFSDDVVSQIAQVLQVALLTGTDIVDNLRTIRVTETDGILYPDPEYMQSFQENIQKMLSDAENMAPTPEFDEV
tara:strand:+ start:277 stop:510 length:234 start_codon:yes stop_codon:yes gene_type:complete